MRPAAWLGHSSLCVQHAARLGRAATRCCSAADPRRHCAAASYEYAGRAASLSRVCVSCAVDLACSRPVSPGRRLNRQEVDALPAAAAARSDRLRPACRTFALQARCATAIELSTALDAAKVACRPEARPGPSTMARAAPSQGRTILSGTSSVSGIAGGPCAPLASAAAVVRLDAFALAVLCSAASLVVATAEPVVYDYARLLRQIRAARHERRLHRRAGPSPAPDAGYALVVSPFVICRAIEGLRLEQCACICWRPR